MGNELLVLMIFSALPLGACFVFNSLLSGKRVAIGFLYKTCGAVVMGLFLSAVFACLLGLLYAALLLIGLGGAWSEALERIIFQDPYVWIVLVIWVLTFAAQFLMAEFLTFGEAEDVSPEE